METDLFFTPLVCLLCADFITGLYSMAGSASIFFILKTIILKAGLVGEYL